MYKNQRLTFINKEGIFSYLAIFILSNLLKKYAAMARCLKISLYIIRRATAQLRGGGRGASMGKCSKTLACGAFFLVLLTKSLSKCLNSTKPALP